MRFFFYLLVIIVLAVGGAELTLRMRKVEMFAMKSVPDIYGETHNMQYEYDTQLRYRPVLITPHRSGNGILKNRSLFDPNAPERILFLGGAAMENGAFIAAVQPLFKREKTQLLNGGVHSYNFEQTVDFYERYSSRTLPQTVVYFLADQDVFFTPFVKPLEDGGFEGYIPSKLPLHYNHWLLQNSRLYQQFCLLQIADVEPKDLLYGGLKLQLSRLKRLVAANKSTLYVVLVSALPSRQDNRHAESEFFPKASQILTDLGIKYYKTRVLPESETNLGVQEDVDNRRALIWLEDLRKAHFPIFNTTENHG